MNWVCILQHNGNIQSKCPRHVLVCHLRKQRVSRWSNAVGAKQGELLPLGTIARLPGVKVGASTVQTEECSASGRGLTLAYAGVQTQVSLTARDAFRNVVDTDFASFSSEITDFQGIVTAVVVSWSAFTSYVARYTVTKAGLYKLSIMNNRINIPQGPWKLEVLAGDVLTRACYIEGNVIKTMGVGQSKEFRLHTVDAYANAITTGGKVFQWAVSGVVSLRGMAVDNFDGTYTILVGSLDIVGLYKFEVKRGVEHILNSPCTLNNVPGSISIFSSSVDMSQVLSARVGELRTVVIQVKDGAQNPIQFGGELFRAELMNSERGSILVPVKDRGDGSYAIDIQSHVSGGIQLHVTLSNVAVGGSSYAFFILPGALSTLKSVVLGTALSTSRVGTMTHVTVEPRDSYGNPVIGHIQADARFQLLQNIANISQAPVLSSHQHRLALDQTGGWSVSLFITVSGLYRASVWLSEGISPQASSQDYITTVLPSDTHAASCELKSNHAAICTASEACDFVLQPRDRFGNKGNEPAEIFGAMIATQERKEHLLLYAGSIKYDPVDANYAIRFVPTRSGGYRVMVTRYKAHVSGSLSRLRVVPGAPVAKSSSAQGFGLLGAVIAQEVSSLRAKPSP